MSTTAKNVAFKADAEQQSSPSANPLKIIVAANNTPSARKALDYALALCSKIPPACYRLEVVHFTALNPQQTLPYIDHLERAYNMEIQEAAEKDVAVCKKYLNEHFAGKIKYEFIEVEGEGETGPLIEEYISESHPDLDLFIVGTRNLGSLQRWALGSVSDYCLHHLRCPVTVVKDGGSDDDT
ncbi:hypothetical protein HDU88_007695 [Geranomyces variabilis]|nr:hypothetical protein BDZ88DRAFT_414464 [Geranomyces variabilis]KAJ3137759.1 hypothetical protein HDU90_001710 [Geranomyces variabilis]KAJ3171615.1 hypothetical protein HDU88_007695 [Geranomyces variabilis]